MNIQQAFNKMVAGLTAQGWAASVSTSGKCLYRGPNGTKCAVGHLLPDVEGVDWNEYPSVIRLLSDDDQTEQMAKAIGMDFRFDNRMQQFLISAQLVHDRSETELAMQNRMHQLGRNFNLEIPPELKLEW